MVVPNENIYNYYELFFWGKKLIKCLDLMESFSK